MLRNISSSKNGWSSFPLEHKKVPDSIATNNLGSAKEDKSQGSKRLVDASVDLAAKSASQLTKDVFHVDALPRSASLGSEQNLVMQTIPSTKVEKDETLDVEQRLRPTVYIKTEAHSDGDDPDVNHLKEPNGSIQPFRHTNKDSQLEDKNHWTLNEVAAEKKPVLYYEASAVVPTVNETDAAASGSQHSWNMQHEGSPEDQNTPTSKAISAGKSHFSIEQQGEKASRYNMRNRGRHR